MNSLSSKKSFNVIPSPSQILIIVNNFGLLDLPFTKLSTVLCVKQDILDNLLIVKLFSINILFIFSFIASYG